MSSLDISLEAFTGIELSASRNRRCARSSIVCVIVFYHWVLLKRTGLCPPLLIKQAVGCRCSLISANDVIDYVRKVVGVLLCEECRIACPHWCDINEALGTINSSTSLQANPNLHSKAHNIMLLISWHFVAEHVATARRRIEQTQRAARRHGRNACGLLTLGLPAAGRAFTWITTMATEQPYYQVAESGKELPDRGRKLVRRQSTRSE